MEWRLSRIPTTIIQTRTISTITAGCWGERQRQRAINLDRPLVRLFAVAPGLEKPVILFFRPALRYRCSLTDGPAFANHRPAAK